MTIEALRKSIESPYGIQSLNTHDIERAIGEFEALKNRNDYLQKIVDGEFPEGCTPSDARVLREANHGMIDENARLRARVAELERSNAMIKADAILEAVEEYKREYCGQGIERLFLDYANQIEGTYDCKSQHKGNAC